MNFSILVLSFFLVKANANLVGSRKSKSITASGSVHSCPSLSGNSGSKTSKAGSGGCGSGEISSVSCGGSFDNQKVFLLKDLTCNGDDDTIILQGQEAVLDCGGRSIIGPGDAGDDDVILELHNGASVINCNFAYGYNAIKTFGEGCSTIENVSVYDTNVEGILVSHTGTVVIKDVSIYDTGTDGIEIMIDEGDDLHAVFENIRVLNAGTGGIDLTCDCVVNECGGNVVAEFYGNIFIQGSGADNLDMDKDGGRGADVDLTVYGNLYAGQGADNIDINDGNSITFAGGSFSELCDALDNEIEYTEEGMIFVEDGAVVVCDDEDPDGGDKCTYSCNVEDANACIE